MSIAISNHTMTAHITGQKSHYFFHSHELRELKVEEDRIIVRLTNNDILTLVHQYPAEIAKDIFAAIENNENLSFPVGEVELR